MKSGVLQIGEVTFDPSTGKLTDQNGQAVQLRNKSKSVLLYLAERPNQTVPKNEILDSVWADVTVSDESLVQCIADIRRLIGKDARQIVETIPREGYRLSPSEMPSPSGRARVALPIAAVAALAVAGVVISQWFAGADEGAVDLPQTTTTATTSEGPPDTTSTEAYLEVLKGRVAASRFGYEESLSAERHFRRAISLDPTYARAYAELGTLLAVRFENDWNVLEEADKAKALFYAERAAELDPNLWLAHYALGRLFSVVEDFEASERHLEMAMSLQPENEDARAYYAVVKNLQGQPEAAIGILEPVVRSHPDPPFWYHFGLGHALFNAERYLEAEQSLTRCIEIAGQSPYCLRYLIATYGALDRLDEAGDAASRYASLGYELSIAAMVDFVRFHHEGDKERLQSGLRRAGVPK